MAPDEFIALVSAEGRARYRDLPWRGIDDPYAVLVSEVMLQQTQVARVKGRWERWLERFPTVDALAAAAPADAVGEWQGLGYNRRALALKRACELCAREYGGGLPRTAAELQELPGIGPATAAGVVAFAYNEPAVYIETNVRTVFICTYFPDSELVHDRQIREALQACLQRMDAMRCDPAAPAPPGPREWYYALLDYGAYLKSTMPNPGRRSAHYARQSGFEGSHRQKRAELLRYVLAQEECVLGDAAAHMARFEQAHGRPSPPASEVEGILDALAAEGFFRKEGRRWAL